MFTRTGTIQPGSHWGLRIFLNEHLKHVPEEKSPPDCSFILIRIGDYSLSEPWGKAAPPSKSRASTPRRRWGWGGGSGWWEAVHKQASPRLRKQWLQLWTASAWGAPVSGRHGLDTTACRMRGGKRGGSEVYLLLQLPLRHKLEALKLQEECQRTTYSSGNSCVLRRCNANLTTRGQILLTTLLYSLWLLPHLRRHVKPLVPWLSCMEDSTVLTSPSQ